MFEFFKLTNLVLGGDFWFHIFMMVAFSMHPHKKEESAFPVLLYNQRNLTKKVSSASTNKNRWVKRPVLVLMVSIETIFLKLDFLCVLKNGLAFISSP